MQNNFERGFGGWYVYRDFYGNTTQVETTLVPRKSNFYLGVGLGLNFEGNYQLRLTDKSLSTNGKYTLFLAKKTTTLVTLKKVEVDPAQYQLELGKPFILKMEYVQGKLKGYLGGELLLTYDDSQSKQCFSIGWSGVWIHPERAAVIEDFHCAGVEQEPPGTNEKQKTDRCYDMCLSDTDEDGRLKC